MQESYYHRSTFTVSFLQCVCPRVWSIVSQSSPSLSYHPHGQRKLMRNRIQWNTHTRYRCRDPISSELLVWYYSPPVLWTGRTIEQCVCVSIHTHPLETLHASVYQHKGMAGLVADTASGLKWIPQQKPFASLNRSVVLYTNVHCAAYLYFIWSKGESHVLKKTGMLHAASKGFVASLEPLRVSRWWKAPLTTIYHYIRCT